MHAESLTGRLKHLIDRLPQSGVTFRQLVHLVGADGMMILTALLTLVFLIPVSIPGVSTVFGAAILLIGVSRLMGRELWVPRAIQDRVLPTDKLRPALHRALGWLHPVEKVSRANRLGWLAAGGPIGMLNNCALILGAVLLMAPFGFVPFSNTLPALALLLLAIGLLQRDGVCILLGHAGNVGTIAYFSVLIAGGGMAIQEGMRRIMA